jgi:hypothetical protein
VPEEITILDRFGKLDSQDHEENGAQNKGPVFLSVCNEARQKPRL